MEPQKSPNTPKEPLEVQNDREINGENQQSKKLKIDFQDKETHSNKLEMNVTDKR